MEKKAESDPDFEELLKKYKEARGSNHYLTERFVQFILTYAPVEKWEEYVPHRDADQEEENPQLYERLIRKPIYEKYPSDINPLEVPKILADSYSYRSSFVHVGQQPPLSDPLAYRNRFFEIHEYEKFIKEEEGLIYYEPVSHKMPTYQLLLGLAKYSIMNWLQSKKK